MEIRTLCDVFYHAVGFRKPDHLKYKQDGVWRDISSDELKQAVEEFSMGLRVLGKCKQDKEAERYAAARAAGDFDTAALIAGEVVDLIADVPPAAQIVERMMATATTLLVGASNKYKIL